MLNIDAYHFQAEGIVKRGDKSANRHRQSERNAMVRYWSSAAGEALCGCYEANAAAEE